jgi:hypothetical protein
MESARARGRYGHRNATMILIASRHSALESRGPQDVAAPAQWIAHAAKARANERAAAASGRPRGRSISSCTSLPASVRRSTGARTEPSRSGGYGRSGGSAPAHAANKAPRQFRLWMGQAADLNGLVD